MDRHLLCQKRNFGGRCVMEYRGVHGPGGSHCDNLAGLRYPCEYETFLVTPKPRPFSALQSWSKIKFWTYWRIIWYIRISILGELHFCRFIRFPRFFVCIMSSLYMLYYVLYFFLSLSTFQALRLSFLFVCLSAVLSFIYHCLWIICPCFPEIMSARRFHTRRVISWHSAFNNNCSFLLAIWWSIVIKASFYQSLM